MDARRLPPARRPVTEDSLASLRARLGRAGPRLYLGAGPAGSAWAEPQQAVLSLGPPRSGKTSSILIPNVLVAPGPVVATSTKPDVLSVSAPIRAAVGRCWLFDPTGTMPATPGLERVRWSPVAAATSWDDTLTVARGMTAAARPDGLRGEAAHWTERAEALLAALLRAAACQGDDMRVVVHWVLRRQPEAALGTLAGRDGGLPRDVLAGVCETDEREQSGIWSSAAGILAAYRSQAALDAATRPNFSPSELVETTDTVYICAPARQQALVAPIVVAFLDQVRAGAYRAATLGRAKLPVLLALDELANIAPLPDLPSLVSEAGSQGVLTLGCLQDLSQARQRWGAAAEGFLSLFGTKLVLPGIGDLATLELISQLAGEVDVPVRSSTGGAWRLSGARSPTVTWSTRRQRRLPVAAVNQLPSGSAIVLTGNRPPSPIALTPWWRDEPFASAVGASRVARAPARPAQLEH